ncbi:hypothetical protein MLGJGCBP_06799 [Rhodococcus sp. T7]|nr:hypothetical protein MLGJGCBP_06799 [Rhodococcus sp. T7]
MIFPSKTNFKYRLPTELCMPAHAGSRPETRVDLARAAPRLCEQLLFSVLPLGEAGRVDEESGTGVLDVLVIASFLDRLRGIGTNCSCGVR